jgi:polysaccharide export outer membrane protein
MRGSEKEKRAMMWINGLTGSFTRFLLLACLASVVASAWASDSAKPALTSKASEASGVGQGGNETARRANTPGTKAVNDEYIIGPSDVLAIDVWKNSELTRTVPVRPDGKISLPLIGELEVSGLTPVDVQRAITQRLKEYISKPQVTVIVQEVKSQTYAIVGKVVRPGSYELGKPTTVLEAIAIAGGFQDFAKVGKVFIIRRVNGGSPVKLHFDYKEVINGRNPGQNVELRSGDTIVVP